LAAAAEADAGIDLPHPPPSSSPPWFRAYGARSSRPALRTDSTSPRAAGDPPGRPLGPVGCGRRRAGVAGCVVVFVRHGPGRAAAAQSGARVATTQLLRAAHASLDPL